MLFDEIHKMTHKLAAEDLTPGLQKQLEELHDVVETAIKKYGRVLSGKNEESLAQAHSILEQATEILRQVLAQTAQEHATPTEKATFTRHDDGSWDAFVPISKIDKERQVVTGIALAANVIDLQDDFIRPNEVWKAMESYMLAFQDVGEMHHEVNPMCKVVECYQAPIPFALGEQPVGAGDWILSVKIGDREAWSKVTDGEYTGFSIGGVGKRMKVEIVPSDVITLEQALA